jgi:hypothetical protein
MALKVMAGELRAFNLVLPFLAIHRLRKNAVPILDLL